jgi:hypothetical protein
MARIIIQSDRKYIKWLAGHLKKEHPKTSKGMQINLKGGRKK